MEGIEKPHVYKYKEITNNWNYDASCKLTSLPVWDLRKFQALDFCCTECTCVQMYVCVGMYVGLHMCECLLRLHVCVNVCKPIRMFV
jgi:hypothetical protein